MHDSTPKSKIKCEIHCMDPATVNNVKTKLESSGIAWIPYTCQISGDKENILLIGNDLASKLAPSLTEAEDANGTKILAGLYSAELCECDVAILTGLSDHEVIHQLQRFETLGVVIHRKIHGMNYYSLNSRNAEQIFSDVVKATS
jgi:hypothetical protein